MTVDEDVSTEFHADDCTCSRHDPDVAGSVAAIRLHRRVPAGRPLVERAVGDERVDVGIRGGLRRVVAARLGFGRTVASGKERPNVSVNLVCIG